VNFQARQFATLILLSPDSQHSSGRRENLQKPLLGLDRHPHLTHQSHLFRHTTGNPVWGHAGSLHMMAGSHLRHTREMPASHSDGVSRHRFVTRRAEQ
jgi:hypothetical protein